jgi:hypothetical protein
MPTTDGTAAAHSNIPSSGVVRRSRQRKVLENRDLCRIVSCYIPSYLKKCSVENDCYGGVGGYDDDDDDEDEDDEDEEEEDEDEEEEIDDDDDEEEEEEDSFKNQVV